LVERHSLTFPTEIGSLKIEIENDLDLFKDQKKSGSDHYYISKLDEIKSELIRLSEEKRLNDIIWKNIKFKTFIGINIYLYERTDDTFLCSIISPDEWNQPLIFLGKFFLSSDGIWKN
jgi:hypothetical protein